MHLVDKRFQFEQPFLVKFVYLKWKKLIFQKITELDTKVESIKQDQNHKLKDEIRIR